MVAGNSEGVVSRVRTRRARVAAAAGLALAGSLVAIAPQPVNAGAFPGVNGRLACERRTGLTGITDEIFTFFQDGSGERQVTNNFVRDGDPSWSPDGTRLAIESFRGGGVSEAWRINATDGSGELRLTENGTPEDRGTSWSPDGTQITFHSTRTGNFEIFRMNADGSNETQLTFHPGQDSLPSWSPDGNRIAFLSRRSGDIEIWTMRASDGGDLKQLTFSPGEDAHPWYSPDGSRIVFHSRRTSTNPQISNQLEIFTMNASDGSDVRQLTSTPDFEAFPIWSPDGEKISYSNLSTGFVETIDAATGGSRFVVARGSRCDWQRLPCTITGSGFIVGTPGDDVICGSAGDDTIVGLGGNDFIAGFGGNDRISGGPGDDYIYGGDGQDQISGDDGDDHLFGGPNGDSISGGPGNDTILGEGGSDSLSGDDGNDTFFGGGGFDSIVGGPGTDVADGGGAPTFCDVETAAACSP